MARALTSLGAVKQLLGLTATAQDGAIQILAAGASAAVLNYIGRDLFATAYTEVRDGTGTPTLMLAQYPATAVISVAIGPPNLARPVLVENRDYIWTSTAIRLLCGCFPRGIANVAVSYVAGLDVAPADLVEKVTKLAAWRFKELDRLGQVSKTMAGETVLFDLSAWPKDVLAVLDNYRKRIPVAS